MKTKILHIIIFSFPLLIFSCSGEQKATTEPAQTGTISGIVTDAETTQPLGFVSIMTLPPTSAVTTDTLGKYSVENVFPDTFYVIATKSGCIRDSVRISVVAGNTTIGDIQMYSDSTAISAY